MKMRRGLLSVVGAVCALVSLSSPASAGFTHYYYDAQGRLLGALSNAHEQRTSQTDNADNPSYLHVFPQNTRPSISTLGVNCSLIADQYLTSTDGRFTFNVQEDGNAVVYEGSTVLWSTGTAGKQPGYFALDANGNLAYFAPTDAVLWSSGQSGAAGPSSQLVMQSDGNLVLSSGSTVYWQSGTGGH